VFTSLAALIALLHLLALSHLPIVLGLVLLILVLLLLLGGPVGGSGGRVQLLLLALLRLLHHPVEHEVVVVAHSVEQVLEEFLKVGDVRFLFELELAAVVEVDIELVRQAFGESLDGGGQLLVPDLLVLLLLGPGSQTLPRQLAFEEVDQHKAQRLEVISATLLDAQMGID
jgi:hypothetical protein